MVTYQHRFYGAGSKSDNNFLFVMFLLAMLAFHSLNCITNSQYNKKQQCTWSKKTGC
jgi:hypothetical protein